MALVSEKHKMTISWIIPCYCAEKTIEDCIFSIVNQPCPTSISFEIIVIDNDSPDGTAKIVQALQERYPEIVYTKCLKRGVSAARNCGIKKATGDWIGFIDADDTLEEQSLRLLAEEIKPSIKRDVIIFGFHRVIEGSGELKKIPYRFNHVKQWSGKKLLLKSIYDDRIFGSVCNKLFRKNIIYNIYFSEDLSHCEDKHFLIKVLSEHPDIFVYVMPTVIYNYWIRSQSATNNVKALFSEEGKFQYDLTMNSILRECRLDKKEIAYIRALKCRLALDVYLSFDNQLEDLQKEELRDIIQKNKYYYFWFSILHPKGHIRKNLEIRKILSS